MGTHDIASRIKDQEPLPLTISFSKDVTAPFPIIDTGIRAERRNLVVPLLRHTLADSIDEVLPVAATLPPVVSAVEDTGPDSALAEVCVSLGHGVGGVVLGHGGLEGGGLGGGFVGWCGGDAEREGAGKEDGDKLHGCWFVLSTNE